MSDSQAYGLNVATEKTVLRCETGFPALRKSLFRGAEKCISSCRGPFSVTRERLFGDVTRLELYCNTVFIVFLNCGDGGA